MSNLVEEDVKPTRQEEIRLKERIDLAENGHEILEKKRDELIHEFMQIVNEAKESRKEISTSYTEANEALKRAEIFDGREKIKSLSRGAARSNSISTNNENIMGVIVPEISFDDKIKMDPRERGYSIESSTSRIDEAADKYEELLEEVIRAAEIQTKVTKLLEEIEKTKRRVNALEHKMIPDMKDALDDVSQALIEKEREETFRMKKVKEKNQNN